MRAFIKIGKIFILAVLAVGCNSSLVSPTSPSSSSSDPASNDSSNDLHPDSSVSQACPSGGVAFTYPLVDPNAVIRVSPLPALAGSVAFEGRSYIFIKDAYTGIKVPIYAPTEMSLYASKTYIPLGAPEGYHAEWALAFDAGCGVSVSFAHIKEVVAAIEEVNLGALSNSSGIVQTSHRVSFHAGDLIGFYIKGGNSIAWDFIVQDEHVQNQYANQARYVANHSKLLTVVCPWDLFAPSLKADYFALLGNPFSNQIGGISCGSVARDVSGTLAGTWYADAFPLVGTATPDFDGNWGNSFSAFRSEDGTILLANIEHTYKVIDAMNPSYVDPAAVTSEHCYSLSGAGWVYTKLLSANTLQVNYSLTGSCPISMPDLGSRIFYR